MERKEFLIDFITTLFPDQRAKSGNLIISEVCKIWKLSRESFYAQTARNYLSPQSALLLYLNSPTKVPIEHIIPYVEFANISKE